jgi:hypothetical protein
MIKIFLNKENFSLIENGVSVFRYSEFDNISMLKINRKLKNN